MTTSPNQGASVELRSSGQSGSTPPPNVPQPLKGFGGKKRDPKKVVGIAVGSVLLLIIIGLGVYAAVRTGNQANEGEGPNGVFGNLPFSDSITRAAVSGLSGNECSHPDRRPIGVMLAGDPINRPVSGFSEADMVFELPALVSNVTRLLAVYQCGEPKEIGSVRSARHDYLFLGDGVDAIVGHWGGSYHALNRIRVGEFQTIDALGNPFNAYFRKSELPAPYNGFTNYENLWNALQQLGYRTETNFDGYDFKDDAPISERPAGGTLTVAWPGQFRVSYEYNPETNRYERLWAGVKQIDPNTNTVVAPSVVAIMRATNGSAAGPGGYNDVGIQGTGELEVYQDGQVIKGTWRKSETKFNDPTHFLDEEGKNITFTRGQVWVMAPSADIPVTWEPTAGAPASVTAPTAQ